MRRNQIAPSPTNVAGEGVSGVPRSPWGFDCYRIPSWHRLIQSSSRSPLVCEKRSTEIGRSGISTFEPLVLSVLSTYPPLKATCSAHKGKGRQASIRLIYWVDRRLRRRRRRRRQQRAAGRPVQPPLVRPMQWTHYAADRRTPAGRGRDRRQRTR